jgi:hypothetical protein
MADDSHLFPIRLHDRLDNEFLKLVVGRAPVLQPFECHTCDYYKSQEAHLDAVAWSTTHVLAYTGSKSPLSQAAICT